jgi:hypothetical protein
MNAQFWNQKAHEYEQHSYRFMAMAMSGKYTKTASKKLEKRAEMNAEMAVIAYQEAKKLQ